MKKTLFALCALTLLLAGCDPEETPKVTPELKLTTEAAVTVPIDGDIVNVEFTSNVDWTAAIDVEKEVASLNVKSGTKDEGKVKITVMPLKEDNAQRVINLTLTPEGGEPVKVVLTQNGPYVPFFEVSETAFEFGTEGGSKTFTISTNVEYTVGETTIGTLKIDGEKAEYTMPASKEIAPRVETIVFTVEAIQVPKKDESGNEVPGETVAKTVIVIASQDGNLNTAFSVDMPEALPVDGVYSVAVSGDYLIVGDKKMVHIFNKGTGAFMQTLDMGVNVIGVTSDDAHNVVIATGSGATGEDFNVIVAPAESLLDSKTYKQVISCKNQFWGYGYFGIKVTGNALKGEAALCLVSGAGQGGAYGVSWQLNDGACADENYSKYTTLPMEGSAMWSSNGGVCRHLTTNIEKGMVYAGYDAHQNLCYNPSMDDASWKKVCALGIDGNNGTLDMDIVEINGHKYCVLINVAYFSWTRTSLSVVNIDDIENPILLSTFNIEEDKEFGAYTNAAIAAEEEDGKLAIYVVDQSFRTISKMLVNSL